MYVVAHDGSDEVYCNFIPLYRISSTDEAKLSLIVLMPYVIDEISNTYIISVLNWGLAVNRKQQY